MASTAFVRARIDEKLRDEASEVLAEFGLTVSDVVRMTLT
ncbi:MAG TPA: type II toxin-antitoxin system RelB/DinJ family antitoxin, partial [Rhizomicrobium sp.]|nr:type II toxin-antitoxin system RelB/DinJ family antitoxin [Rhizomicrobium sp.]